MASEHFCVNCKYFTPFLIEGETEFLRIKGRCLYPLPIRTIGPDRVSVLEGEDCQCWEAKDAPAD